MQQNQFLHVIDRDEAERVFQAALDLRPLSAETIPLGESLHRVLAEDVSAPVDVPGFDRSNVDGFAVRAEDTFGATEDQPAKLRLNAEVIAPGTLPSTKIAAGTASAIATGAVIPRGGDAVVMVEDTDTAATEVIVRRPVTPGGNISFAGTDIGRGETVLRRGEILTSRETGVLAALGLAAVPVVRRPRVAILSTGNELIAPGQPMRPGLVYDSNAVILADAVRELGGEPIPQGIVADDGNALRRVLELALAHDLVLLSGGTSKGEGDLSYRVVANLGHPGILAHGVALKPGKPLCLAAVQRNGRTIPVVILPGFPTSAIFTFHEFVAPVIRRLAGMQRDLAPVVAAQLPMRVNSERGRTEYLLVGLIQASSIRACSVREDTGESLAHAAGSERTPEWVAYPMGKGSGSVTTFSRADGFIVIPRQQEFVAAGTLVNVHLLDRELRPADLVVIGSHCVGLDFLLGQMQEQGFRSKFLAAGSTGGLEAAKRGECDLAGIHLFDPATGTYNQPFVTAGLVLLPGYRRLQGIVFRPGDPRFEGFSPAEAIRNALSDPDCVMVNRNRGSGTRILLDQLLEMGRSGQCPGEPAGTQPGRQGNPPGYFVEAKSHNAVVAAVAQGRTDWGVAIATAARDVNLGILPLQEERFDFVVPESRQTRPAVRAFAQLLADAGVRRHLGKMGFLN